MLERKTIFFRVKALSKEQKLSIGQINELAGLTPGTIYRWKYHEPAAVDIAKVARVLAVSSDYLLGVKQEVDFLQKKLDLSGLLDASEHLELYYLSKKLTSFQKKKLRYALFLTFN